MDKMKMKDTKFKFKVITPIFSYGADNGSERSEPEIRPASVKGMMRYMFRIAQPTLETKELLEYENKIFGDAESKASPVRLAVVEHPKPDLKPSQFLHHKKQDGKYKKHFMKRSIQPDKNFSIRMSLRPKHLRDHLHFNELKKRQHQGLSAVEKKEFERLEKEKLKDPSWYQSLLELSFVLVGLGQRSRRGRGRAQNIDVDRGLIDIDADQMKCEILKRLNNASVVEKKFYKFNDDSLKTKIIPIENSRFRQDRPVIEIIVFGELISKGWENFLESVDEASHKIKLDRKKSSVKRSNHNIRGWYYATGWPKKPRFSSAIIASIAETSDGFLPIYTCVKPVLYLKDSQKEEILCTLNAKQELDEFINHIESKGGGRL